MMIMLQRSTGRKPHTKVVNTLGKGLFDELYTLLAGVTIAGDHGGGVHLFSDQLHSVLWTG